ncbi:hypothetical protein [Flavobacterium sp. Root420]|uniref:hypothetical protein n=1 Tax=Flavobacterium sp. Root420 TaxID=1736533 RepID=UPI0006F36E26|nr:hypothetical protein [Flavobacterium sp. Root420]KQX15075.1 hypothetical protein ASC72_17945 [Flavobacterium sp. Root420]
MRKSIAMGSRDRRKMMRLMQDTRIGRFFAVDPLLSKYPYWSPYVFSGNRVIKTTELEGEEPNKNPKIPSKSEELAMTTVANIVYQSVQNTNRMNGPLTRDQSILKGDYNDDGTSCFLNTKTYNGFTYITDTSTESANTYNMYVNNSESYFVDESNSKKFNNYEAYVVGSLTYNFFNGTGPENYVFPENGIISSKFKDSDIVKKALEEYKSSNGAAQQFSFGFSELAKDANKNSTLFSITGFVGSGTIVISPKKDDLQVQIFNITSLTSGAFGKELFFWDKEKYYPKSYVRKENENVPFGNISQTFSFTVSKKSLEENKPKNKSENKKTKPQKKS